MSRERIPTQATESPTLPEPELWSRAELARRLGLRPATLREWSWRARQGLRLPEGARELMTLERRPAGRVMFARVEVEALWARQRERAAEDAAIRSADGRGEAAGLARDLATRLRVLGQPALAGMADALAGALVG
ncbi:MAG TPA: hypothetical protein PK668_24010 [Myxococcota bacterium]|nr:hypothetical protein [Myxococcota bacterium]HRY95328.1 hypothetical protein [Myxococcota bacterium]HSA20782.1 hypothetical protein [Myxococcota bacterium]